MKCIPNISLDHTREVVHGHKMLLKCECIYSDIGGNVNTTHEQNDKCH